MKITFFAILAAASSVFALECCEQTSTAGAPSTANLLGTIGVLVGADVPVGLNCNPITVIGLGSTSCTSQPVNCTDVFSKSLIGIGCTPANVGL